MTYLSKDEVNEIGISLPKRFSFKYRNLISADGQTYYIVPSPAWTDKKIAGSKSKTRSWWTFAKRYDVQTFPAVFIGVQRGLSAKPIDWTRIYSSGLVMHSTPVADIISRAENLNQIQSNRAVAIFDLPINFASKVRFEGERIKTITFTGQAPASTVHLCIEYYQSPGEGGLAQYTSTLQGLVFEGFKATLNRNFASTYLWNEALSVRLGANGIFEFDSIKMDGTLYLRGNIVQ